jgi:hypothetical protein
MPLRIGFAIAAMTATMVSRAIADAPDIPDDTEFVVSRVIDATAISGTVRGTAMVVHISEVAHINELDGDTHDARSPFPARDIRRFKDGQAISANYLQCVLLSATRVTLMHMKHLEDGQASGDVYVAFGSGPYFLRMSVAHLMIYDGFALPSFGPTEIRTTEEGPLDESVVVNCLNVARGHKCGLWADEKQTVNGVLSVALPRDVNPALAMPLRSFSMLHESRSTWPQLKETPRGALTIVCRQKADAEKIACDATWINTQAVEFIGKYDRREILATGFVERLTQQITLAVASRLHYEGDPEGIRVIVRYFAVVEDGGD